MAEQIKLTKDIFSCYRRNDYDDPLEIVIYVDTKEQGKIIQQQILENQEKAEKITPDSFVKWQMQCVCDFESNHYTHSIDCLSRFKIIKSKCCSECDHHLILEHDKENCECDCHGEDDFQ